MNCDTCGSPDVMYESSNGLVVCQVCRSDPGIVIQDEAEIGKSITFRRLTKKEVEDRLAMVLDPKTGNWIDNRKEVRA